MEENSGHGKLPALHVYVGVLSVALVAMLAWSAQSGELFNGSIAAWLSFTALFAISEYIDFFFHHERGRQSLNPSVSVLLPMVVFLSLPQVVWGVTLAMILVRATHWREGTLKFAFNVAQYGCATGIAALVWSMLGSSLPIDLRDAAVAAVSVGVFEGLTHFFVAGAISLAEGRGLLLLLRTILPTAVPLLASNTLVGLLLAAAYAGARWTLALSPLMLIVFYITSRAVSRQSSEKERLEHLHAATRILAAGRNLDSALAGFLRSVAEIVSAAEAHVIITTANQLRWWGIRGDTDIARMEPAGDGPFMPVLSAVREGPRSVIVREDDLGSLRHLPRDIGVRSLVAVPLLEDESVVGELVVCDRIGADEFGGSDAQLLEALADELVLALDSYRLFAEVAEERERFRRIFLGSKEGISLVDPHGIVRAWNPALTNISAVEEEEAIGRAFWDVLVLRDEDGNQLTGIGPWQSFPKREVEVERPDGTGRWVSLLPGPLQSGEGGGWVVLVRDITAEYEIEVAKSDFLTTVSHELRTPLTGIKGSLDVLANQLPDLPPGADRIIGVARWGALRLERLVMNLLTVSEIEKGSMLIKSDELKLEDLVRERATRALAGHPSIEVVVHEEALTVTADKERLDQVIDQLLDNAHKFGGGVGKISVEVRKANGYAQVSVSDEGPGIPGGDHERIFERFVRLGDVTTRSTQGAGVGLFIARRSIEAMGGRIWVEAESEQGARFHMTVPLASSAPRRDSDGGE